MTAISSVAGAPQRALFKIEEHRPVPHGYKITNRVFASQNGFDSGKECQLTDIPMWSGISSCVTLKNVSRPLFAYFGIPLANSDFPSSPLGVPVFRRAEKLIRQADIQYSRLLWEFEGGELAVDCSEDAFRVGKDGKPELPLGKERLYRTNTLDACNSTGELIQTYAPSLRDESLINGLNRIIMFVEDACGIARGTFSDPTSVAKTATEILAMRQRTLTTVATVRSALSSALYSLVDALGIFISLYGLAESVPNVNIRFGDGVLTDTEAKRSSEHEDVKCGIISADEFRSRWY